MPIVSAQTGRETDALAKRISQLVIEAQSARSLYEDIWDNNFDLYNGDHWKQSAPEGLTQFTLNRTQNAIIASVAVQTEQRPAIRLSPVESNEPPVLFLSPVGAQKLDAVLEGGEQLVEGFSESQVRGEEAISGEHVAALAALPDFDPSTDIFQITDAVVTDSVQRVFDVMWDRSGADFAWTENILYKSVVGHTAMLIQWDEQTGLPEYINCHPKAVWIDPTAHGIEDAAYLIYDQTLSVEEAIARFPEHETEIRKAETVTPGLNEESTAASRPYSDVKFERNMVTLRTAWLRHEMLPLSPDDAIDAGVVAFDEETGAFVTDEGESTGPSEPSWPKSPGIRQVMVINGATVDDRRCPYDNIPVAWNVNIPIPLRPYGQGEPERMESLQKAINRIVSILHNHCKYFQSPMSVLPVSVKNRLPKGAATHAHPGKTYTLPDELIEQFGRNLKIFVDPPSLPASYIEFLGLLLAEANNISGHSDVMQGNTPSRVESGRAIDLLQTAARGVISFKSLYTERALVYMTRLVIGMIRDFLDADEWSKYVSDMPRQALVAMQERSKLLDFDIRVEVVSGKGTSRQFKQQQAINEYQAGLRSRISTMKALEVPDAEKEVQLMLADPINALVTPNPTEASMEGSAPSQT